MDDEALGVRAAFSYSYAHLDEQQAAVFRACGLHPGGRFSTEAVGALTGLTTSTAFRILDQLTQLSLLEALPSRQFQMHDLLRLYAAEAAHERRWRPESTVAVRQLVLWYLHAARAASRAIKPSPPDQTPLRAWPADVPVVTFGGRAEAYRWFAREAGAVHGIARLARDQGMLFSAWRIPVDFSHFFHCGRPLEVWIHSFEVAMEAAEASGNELRIGEAASELADVYARRREPGDIERARSMALRAIDISPTPHGFTALALVVLGTIECEDNQFAGGLELCERALVIARQAHDIAAESQASIQIGIAQREIGYLDLAERAGENGLEIAQRSGDLHRGAVAALALARTYRVADRLSLALHFCDHASDAFKQCEDTQGRAESLAERALALYALDKVDEAWVAFTEARDRLVQEDGRVAAGYEADWTLVSGVSA
ncbi:MAG TPA: hypothetical protein VGL46_09500 [Pseudonocardiaceae bacterium]